MASFLYTNYKRAALAGEVALLTDTIKVMLVSSSYTPNETAHTVLADVSAHEIAAGSNPGYTAGGITLTSKTVTADTVDREGVFDAADVSWTSSTITARAAIIYRQGVSATPSTLIAYVDFGSNQSSSNGTFQISWNAEGIINWT